MLARGARMRELGSELGCDLERTRLQLRERLPRGVQNPLLDGERGIHLVAKCRGVRSGPVSRDAVRLTRRNRSVNSNAVVSASPVESRVMR